MLLCKLIPRYEEKLFNERILRHPAITKIIMFIIFVIKGICKTVCVETLCAINYTLSCKAV